MSYVLAASAVGLTAVVQPGVGRRGCRVLDAGLVAYLLAVAAALVPLPPALRFALSPSARIVDLTLRLGDAPAEATRPLSIDPAATGVSLALAIAAVLVFWCARDVFARGGIRRSVRAVAALGLVLAAIGMAQHATAPRALYWMFPSATATPFGPFMNHSDFATWLVMALPLTAGYLIARLHSRQAPGGIQSGLAEAFDNTAMWLTTAIGLMSAGLVVGLSRSGIVAAGAGLASVWALSSLRMRRRARMWLLAGLVAIGAIGAAYANTTAVVTRVNETVALGLGGRRAIWRETWPMIKDFWLTGVGPGAYERAMLVYQQSSRVVYFNHAHNEYLQIAAEGGLLLTIPAMIIAVAAVSRMRRTLLADRTPIYWVRAGAVGGIVAVGIQSLWETGLRVPANGLLFAVVAAIATHDAQRD